MICENELQIIALESNEPSKIIEAINQLTNFKTLEYLIISDTNLFIQKCAYERAFKLFPYEKMIPIKNYLMKYHWRQLSKRMSWKKGKLYAFYKFGDIHVGIRHASKKEQQKSLQNRLKYHAKKIYGDDLEYLLLLEQIRTHIEGVENSLPEDYPVLMWCKYHDKWIKLNDNDYISRTLEIPKGLTHNYPLSYFTIRTTEEDGSHTWIHYSKRICRFEDGTIKILNLKRK